MSEKIERGIEKLRGSGNECLKPNRPGKQVTLEKREVAPGEHQTGL